MTDNLATKKCPDCAEEVRSEARKCRFCGFIFAEPPESEPTPELPEAEPVFATVALEATERPQTPNPAAGAGFFAKRLTPRQQWILAAFAVGMLLVVALSTPRPPSSGGDSNRPMDSNNFMDGVKLLLIVGVTGVVIYFAAMAKKGENILAKVKASQDGKIVCPQCRTAGFVTTNAVERKKGVSGGKAAGAILTGGVSLLLVGLSRQETATEAKCSNCGSVWHF